jgi:hypothetical protein
LAFTAVSRTLQGAAGQSPKTSFLVDLALNAGLFSVLRFTGSMIHATVTERGMEITGMAATQAANIGILQAFGAVHFRIEEGHWPSADEFRSMTGDNLIMYAAMMRTKGSAAKARAHSRLAVLERLHGKYADRLAGIEEARARLAARIYTELASNRPTDPATTAALRTEQEALRRSVEDVLGEIGRDPAISVEKLRTELSDPALQTEEVSSELLAGSFDVPPEAGLRRAGGENQYTYAHGETDVIVDALAAREAVPSAAVEASGLHTVAADPPGQPPMFFTERPEVPPPEPAPPKRRRLVQAPPQPAPPPKPERVRTPPKGEVFAAGGGLTKQGVTVVREMRGKRNLTPGEANMELAGSPAVLERVVKEHFQRAINRGEIPGRLIAGGRTFASTPPSCRPAIRPPRPT